MNAIDAVDKFDSVEFAFLDFSRMTWELDERLEKARRLMDLLVQASSLAELAPGVPPSLHKQFGRGLTFRWGRRATKSQV